MALFGSGEQDLTIVIRAKDLASKTIADTQRSLKGLHGTMMGAADASRSFAFSMTAVGAALGGVATLGINTAAELETARQGLVTLLGSTEAADKTLKRLKLEAARTPFELPGLTQATQLLSSVTKDGDRSIDILLDVGEALAAMGKGQAELDRIIVNLQQVAAVGRASSVDIKQFAFAGIPIFEMLQKETGLAGEALEKFVEDGGVTFEMLTQMFDNANDAGGRFFNAFQNQAGTFNQLWSNMKDNVTVFLADLVQSTGIFDMAKNAIAAFNNFLAQNADRVKNAIVWLSEHKEVLAAVAGAIVGALVPALYAAAAALAVMFLNLAPFMALGGLIAYVLTLTGGFDGLRQKVSDFLAVLDEKTGLITLLQWAIDNVATTIREHLFPALRQWWDAVKELWVALEPIHPFLGLLAKAVGVALVGAIYLVVTAITGWIQLFTHFMSIAIRVGAVISEHITGPIKFVVEWATRAVEAVGKLIDKIQSLARVKDKVTGGLGAVGKSLSNLLGFEHGGIVPGPVGTAVPILAHAGERIIPQHQARGSGPANISVTINNPTVRNDRDLDAMKRMIDDTLRGLMRDHKLATV